MRKSIIFFLFIFIYNALHLTAQESNLKFKGPTVYLGTIEEDKLPKTITFSYINNSNLNIRIIDINVSNDCKVSNWNKLSQIKPNMSGFINIVFNSTNIGVFNEKVLVKTSEPGGKEIILSFGGEIVPRKKTLADRYAINDGSLNFKKNNLNFGEIKNSQKKSDTLYFMNTSKKTITIEATAELPPFINIQYSNTEIKPSTFGKITITYDASLRNAYGKTKDTITIQTDDEMNPLKEIYLTADIFEDFSKIKPDKLKLAPDAYLENTTFDFRYAKKGTDVKAVFNIKNKGKTQLVIRKADASCDCIQSKYADKIRFDRNSPIEVTINTTHLKGNIHETITLVTNDPKQARIVLHITGFIE